jgi:putative hydrolase of the HAD superfamily
MSSQLQNQQIDWKALILDYGEVLCTRPTAEDFGRMAKMLGIRFDSFGERWESSRPPYDRGDLKAEEYWLKFAKNSNTTLDAEQIEILRKWEIEMWAHANLAMVEWMLDVNAAGIKTALLSNMPADLAAHLQGHFAWMDKFAIKIFSAHVRLVKPDPEIFWHTLRYLGAMPADTLFVDDREVNVKVASGLGMHAVRFQSVAQLLEELKVLGFPILPASH